MGAQLAVRQSDSSVILVLDMTTWVAHGPDDETDTKLGAGKPGRCSVFVRPE